MLIHYTGWFYSTYLPTNRLGKIFWYTANPHFTASWGHTAPKNNFSEFICGRWYSSTGDDLKNAFIVKMDVWSSLADNWDLDEFFETFIWWYRWYIYSSKADDNHLCRPIIIPSGWLSSAVVDYDPQWLNIISSGWL
jgi:hypothetical protein